MPDVPDLRRAEYVQKITETEEALQRTKSSCCKRDLQKSLARMKKELLDYDRFHAEAAKQKMKQP